MRINMLKMIEFALVLQSQSQSRLMASARFLLSVLVAFSFLHCSEIEASGPPPSSTGRSFFDPFFEPPLQNYFEPLQNFTGVARTREPYSHQTGATASIPVFYEDELVVPYFLTKEDEDGVAINDGTTGGDVVDVAPPELLHGGSAAALQRGLQQSQSESNPPDERQRASSSSSPSSTRSTYILRFRDMLRLALRGQPFVVRKGRNGGHTTNWPFRKWTCADFGAKFPDAEMRDELDHETRTKVSALSVASGGGSATRTSTITATTPTRFQNVKSKLHMASGSVEKLNAPFVWHVKDEAPADVKRRLQQDFVSPPWARTLEDADASSSSSNTQGRQHGASGGGPSYPVVGCAATSGGGPASNQTDQRCAGVGVDSESSEDQVQDLLLKRTTELAARQRAQAGDPFFATRLMNSWTAKQTFEMWFSPPGGTAVYAHADSYCEVTASWQLRGRKRWRTMMYPKGDSLEHRFNTFDEGIYGVPNRPGWETGVVAETSGTTEASSSKKSKATTHLWRPEYDFELGAGDLVVFPPNYMHETYVEPRVLERVNRDAASINSPGLSDQDDVEEDGQCAIAATFQVLLPTPTKYFRTFLPRHMNSHLQYEESDCVPSRFWKYAFLSTGTAPAAAGAPRGPPKPFPVLDRRIWLRQARAVWREMDLFSGPRARTGSESGVNANNSTVYRLSADEVRKFLMLKKGPSSASSSATAGTSEGGRSRSGLFFQEADKLARMLLTTTSAGAGSLAWLAGASSHHDTSSGNADQILVAKLRAQILEVRLQELFGWQDVDEDGFISAGEVYQSIAQLHVLSHRQTRMQAMLDTERIHNPAVVASWLVRKWATIDEQIYKKQFEKIEIPDDEAIVFGEVEPRAGQGRADGGGAGNAKATRPKGRAQNKNDL